MSQFEARFQVIIMNVIRLSLCYQQDTATDTPRSLEKAVWSATKARFGHKSDSLLNPEG